MVRIIPAAGYPEPPFLCLGVIRINHDPGSTSEPGLEEMMFEVDERAISITPTVAKSSFSTSISDPPFVAADVCIPFM